MTDTARRIARIATDHCATWTRADLDGVAEMCARDGMISVNGAQPHVGHDEIKESAHTLMETFPGVVVRCIGTRHASERAVFTWTLDGCHAETDHEVHLEGWHEWELDGDRKVRRCRGFYDADDLARQVARD